MPRSDVVVIGGGLNGLCVSAILARAGRSVHLVEASDKLGGLASRREFAPGYIGAGVFADAPALRPRVIQELELERHGLKLRPKPADVLCVGRGEPFLLSQAKAAFPADATAYREYREFFARIDPIVAAFLDESPIRVTSIESEPKWELAKRALRLRRLGRGDMVELLRVAPMAVADYLDERFESEDLKAALALPSLRAGFTGPKSPGTCGPLLFAECARGPGVLGGSAMVAQALEASAREAGVEITSGDRVRSVLLEGGKVRGVLTRGGRNFSAPIVVATCHPQTLFFELMAPPLLSVRLAERMENYRSRGTTAHMLLALSSQVALQGGAEFARITGNMMDIERAFDPIKYGEIPRAPALEVFIPSLSDPTLCEKGGSVVSVLVHFVPEKPKGKWSEAERETLREGILSQLERLVPDVRESLVGEELMTPRDLRQRHHLPGGNLFHGEPGLDQILVRPVPEAADYHTPFPGLYLAGSGSHGGGGPNCAPAYLAAQTILND